VSGDYEGSNHASELASKKEKSVFNRRLVHSLQNCMALKSKDNTTRKKRVSSGGAKRAKVDATKVFISHASGDAELAVQISDGLKMAGYEVWLATEQLRPGDVWAQSIQEALDASRFLLVLLSPSFLASKWTRLELEAFVRREIEHNEKRIVPILVGDGPIPVSLQDRVVLDFRGTFSESMSRLLSALANLKASPKTTSMPIPATRTENRKESLQSHVMRIRSQFRKGRLTLFCGAGVSVGAGIPPWNALLLTLLTDLFRGKLAAKGESRSSSSCLARIYRDTFGASPLLLAQHLKNGMGADFPLRVRDALYPEKAKASKLIESIVRLARPQRASPAIQAIVTYNFDDLVERALLTANIRHQSVHREGQRVSNQELPIYHVHGYLPSNGDVSKDHALVFSEDAYHSQFIDSFSWSNLIQLNQLGQNTCVFIGVSLTDPNLRRLLDVSMRKNPDQTLNHFVFKRHISRDEVASQMAQSDSDVDPDVFVRIVEHLEEEDASKLGLSVLWIDDFNEIPGILDQFVDDS